MIRNSGKQCTTETLTNKEFKRALNLKLIEEVEELIHASNPEEKTEELADVFEVANMIAKMNGIALEDIEKSRVEKAQTRGGFEHKVYLKDVED